MLYDKKDLVEMLKYPRCHNSPMEKEFIETYIDRIPGMKADGFGNRYIRIGMSDTAFLSHTDTVHSCADSTKKQVVLSNDGFAFKDRLVCEFRDASGVCLTPFSEHTSDKVASLEVRTNKKMMNDKELQKFISACDQILTKENISGIVKHFRTKRDIGSMVSNQDFSEKL